MPNMPRLLIAVALSLVLAGCFFQTQSYRTVRLFDLGRPESIPATATGLQVGEFSVAGPYRFKMVQRTASHELRIDEYQHWAQSPPMMIARYLRQAYSRPTLPARHVVSGEILVFEADQVTGTAVLEVDYLIRDTLDRDRPVAAGCGRFTAPMAEPTGAEFALAMTAAMAQFADELLRHIPASSPMPVREEASP